MDSWLTYSDFKEKYPDSSLTEPQFTPMAIDAALFIENATRWCASIAAEPEQTEPVSYTHLDVYKRQP